MRTVSINIAIFRASVSSYQRPNSSCRIPGEKLTPLYGTEPRPMYSDFPQSLHSRGGEPPLWRISTRPPPASSRGTPPTNLFPTAVNGEQTLDENIAGLSGISAAYDAYRASLARKTDPVQNGFTGDQQFFLAFAQSWCSKSSEAFLRQTVMTDVHSPDEFRPATQIKNSSLRCHLHVAVPSLKEGYHIV